MTQRKPTLKKAGATKASVHRVACSACPLGELCFPEPMSVNEPTQCGLGAERLRQMQCGQILFHAGTTQTSLYAVRAGFLKTCAPLPNGARQIVAFHLMGDVLGLDALAAGIHRTDAVALSGCEICEIPLVNFELLMEDRLEISDHVRNLLSREIACAEEHIVTLSAMSAKQRVATFLLEFSRRWRERGDSPDEFVLPMSRKRDRQLSESHIRDRQPDVFVFQV